MIANRWVRRLLSRPVVLSIAEVYRRRCILRHDIRLIQIYHDDIISTKDCCAGQLAKNILAMEICRDGRTLKAVATLWRKVRSGSIPSQLDFARDKTLVILTHVPRSANIAKWVATFRRIEIVAHTRS